VWPVRGEISQGYSSGHRAIDISTEHGAVVVAADAGTVVYARWESSGYGYLVIVDHGNGFVSYYAHLYGFYIDAGHQVARGEQIGELGTTGRSTGPHLHFEIRHDGVQRNPLDILP
jgi:murein DD-endopeptidase MepM/ murein hydrolase activator NlpD